MPLILGILLQYIRKRRQLSRNLENYIQFLEKLVLKVQNQQSFSYSIKQLDAESDAFMQQNTFIYDEFVLFSTHNEANLSEFQIKVRKDLHMMSGKPHYLKEALLALVYEEKQKIYFRHKSGQISFQARFQAYLMLGMFLVIALVQVNFVGMALSLKYFLYALPLMLISFCWIYKIMRSFRWKV